MLVDKHYGEKWREGREMGVLGRQGWNFIWGSLDGSH